MTRSLTVIAADLQVALKREAADIIAIGVLLIEAKEQLDHGAWLPWLEENFNSSVSTAQNYMNAAEFAAKFPTVRNLKLRPTALYLMGHIGLNFNGSEEEEMQAVSSEAETKWVNADRVHEILDDFEDDLEAESEQEVAETEPEIETEPETVSLAEADKPLPATVEPRSSFAEQTKWLDDIMKKSNESNQPATKSEEKYTAEQMAARLKAQVEGFDMAVEMLTTLKRNPIENFTATKCKLDDIRHVADFLNEIADAIEEAKMAELKA